MQIVLRNDSGEFCSEVYTISGYQKRAYKKKRIAFLGGLSAAKGSRMAYQMITSQAGSKYDWYLIGGLGDSNLDTLTAKNVRKIGWYPREDVAVLLQQNHIDLVCILPIWPETFCYTVSEAELAGIPVLATDIGAPSERIQKDRTGWIMPVNASVTDAMTMLDGIFEDEEALAATRSRLAAFEHRSIQEMCAAYSALYGAFNHAQKGNGAFDPQMIFNGFVMGQGGFCAEGTDMNLVQRVNELEATLHNINRSLEYRLVKFLNRKKFPFKKQIKRLIGFVYKVHQKLKRKG